MEAYRLKNLSFTYPGEETKMLDQIALSVQDGEFVALCGKSGSGKSTLLRQLKSVLAPHGRRDGEILYRGESLDKVEQRRQASEIGFVLQNPDNQIVTDKVWHELAFGLESLGCDQGTIRLRVAEMASFFGIQTWFHKKVSELSGGQKQILNLASIMAMQPSVLLLDEPTSMLDPIAANEFLVTLTRINRELGVTIIISEHRLEEVLVNADRLVVMVQGRIVADGRPAQVGHDLHGLNHPMFMAMPAPMRITKGVRPQEHALLTINEARKWITSLSKDRTKLSLNESQSTARPEPVAIQLEEVWFRYDRRLPDVVKDLSLDVRQGEFYCIVGGNGTGKTTALSLLCGIHRPYRGKVKVNGAGRMVMLPQNPQNLFVEKTVASDLLEVLSDSSLTKAEKAEKVEEVIRLTGLEHVLNRHPYDLSGGEQQRAALAKILLLEPRIILMDEPTKGLDAFFKETFARIIKDLLAKEVTVVMVSHDIEFCAKHADICALFFDGGIVASDSSRAFFAGNSFYTTAANRIARHLCAEAVTVEDVIRLCRQEAF
ncbi:ABC transporter ATP-binding protein [Paenibacillus sp. PAMC21692]|uniref:ABC transporter ATP-binding protein n=1 Tax=Paenibacillus sp. PAMC21692 TaxID=2762320 RepID=UPI00164E2017|nr:energy-coupling factor transporter ATPase [Paenibacillus sp. PAMC21692]QNK60209.1 ABC transporter ATP-binding protein [Paenibacillus sp. PAMC21692]